MLIPRAIAKFIAMLLIATTFLQPLSAILSNRMLTGVARPNAVRAAPLEVAPQQEDTVFLPYTAAPQPAPTSADFVINSPTTKLVGGTFFFSVQPVAKSVLTSVTFKAGSQTLGTDTTASDGFALLVDAKTLTAGNVTLSATSVGPAGTSTESLQVEVVPNPAASATIGPNGAVVATEIGSVIGVPPGDAPPGTTISVRERTQEQVTADHGINWDQLGVTFLGAQELDASQPFTSALTVSSAGYGNRVQPGQAVVTYQILPDADGDGISELVVVNGASVASNNAVVSDPVDPIMMRFPASDSSSGAQIAANSITGAPGTIIQLPATGFNPLSPLGNVAVFRSEVNGQSFKVNMGVLTDAEGLEGTDEDLIIFPIPPLPAGAATLTLQNLGSGAESGPIDVQVLALPELTRPAAQVLDEFFAEAISFVQALPVDTPEGETERAKLIDQYLQARVAIEQLSQDPSPEIQERLRTVAAMAQDIKFEPDVNANATNLGWEQIVNKQDLCATEDEKLLARLANAFMGAIAGSLCALITPVVLPTGPLGAGVVALCGASVVSYYFFNDYQIDHLKTCPEPNEVVCIPSPKQPIVQQTTGPGSAPVPGGVDCGAARTAFLLTELWRDTPLDLAAVTQVRKPIIVKFFAHGTNNLITPFSGVADAAGYYYVPLLPQGEPFTAVAFDTNTGISQKKTGIGPAVGDSVVVNFDLTQAPEEGVIRWDGLGDGVSWQDPFNWDKSVLPSPNDHVIIDVPGNVTVTLGIAPTVVKSLESAEALIVTQVPFTVTDRLVMSNTLLLDRTQMTFDAGFDLTLADLTMSQSTLTVNGNRTFNGNVNMNMSTLVDNGAVTLNGVVAWRDTTLSGSGKTVVTNKLQVDNVLVDAHTLDNQGTTVWNSGNIILNNKAIFNNLAGATFEDRQTTNGNITWFGSVRGYFNNLGSYVKSGDTTSLLYHNVTNTGTFIVEKGILQIAEAMTNTGALSVQSGAVLYISDGTHSFAAGSTITIAGELRLKNGSLTINGNHTLDGNVTLTGGILVNNGTLTLNGTVAWNLTTAQGSGKIVVTKQLQVSGYGMKMNAQTLDNHGTTTWDDGWIVLDNGAVFNNLAGATFEDRQTTNQQITYGSVPGFFNNAGAYIKSGDSKTVFYTQFTNNGTLTAQKNTLEVQHTLSNKGTLHLDSGTTAKVYGALVNETGGVISGNGTVDAGSGTFTNNGTVQPNGNGDQLRAEL